MTSPHHPICRPCDEGRPAFLRRMSPPARSWYNDPQRVACHRGRSPLSRKHKPYKPGPASPQEVRHRLDRARHEGRSQAALELSKELFKQQPTPAHRDLVRTCYLQRAKQLRSQNLGRDAAAVLQTALQFSAADQPPEWLEKVAEELTLCGHAAQALPLLDRVPETGRPRLLARLGDAAVQQEAAGRNLLPESLRPDFDRVLQAFAQLHAGQDDAVRETLQGIGLKSAFLEWKLLIRGLQAFYLHDDARALENWQRLDLMRLPARLAAPYRFQLDPTFRTAQSPEAQKLLQRQGDSLAGPGVAQDLRRLQADVIKENGLPAAFRQAEALLPRLKQEAPQLVPRLAR